MKLEKTVKYGLILAALITIYGCKEKDKIKPEMSLKGKEALEISIGDEYTDSGVTVTDNVDKGLDSKVKITILKDNAPVDKVDTKKEAIYLIKYNVSDESGNIANEISRRIEVVDTRKFAFIKAKKVEVLDEIGAKGKSLGALTKGIKIERVEEKKDETGNIWTKIKTDSLNGWVEEKALVATREELLNEKYKDLDYTAFEKKEYPNNPKVKVKGVYVNIYTAGSKKLDTFIQMTKETEINAFVIDVKDDNGNLLFPMEAGNKYAPKANSKNAIKDIKAFMKKLKDNNIYAIARIVSFKDPIYTEAHPDRAIVYKATGKPFTNSDNLKWATAYDKELWNYNIAVAKEAVEAGFNEIQFDYVRFPASNGGKLDASLDYRNEKNESKAKAIQEYLKNARKELSPLGVYISADVFGLVTTHEDDMGLGQYWEGISNVTDYICPMIYPSHYGNNVYGLPVPDAYPYETVYRGTKDGLLRNENIKTPAGIRPWIQDFTAIWVKGHIKYGEEEVKKQIKALKDNGVEEYLLWNASNRYSEGAVKK